MQMHTSCKLARAHAISGRVGEQAQEGCTAEVLSRLLLYAAKKLCCCLPLWGMDHQERSLPEQTAKRLIQHKGRAVGQERVAQCNPPIHPTAECKPDGARYACTKRSHASATDVVIHECLVLGSVHVLSEAVSKCKTNSSGYCFADQGLPLDVALYSARHKTNAPALVPAAQLECVRMISSCHAGG